MVESVTDEDTPPRWRMLLSSHHKTMRSAPTVSLESNQQDSDVGEPVAHSTPKGAAHRTTRAELVTQPIETPRGLWSSCSVQW